MSRDWRRIAQELERLQTAAFSIPHCPEAGAEHFRGEFERVLRALEHEFGAPLRVLAKVNRVDGYAEQAARIVKFVKEQQPDHW